MKAVRTMYILILLILVIITILAAIFISKNLLAKRAAQSSSVTVPPTTPVPKIPPAQPSEPRSLEVLNPSGTCSVYIEPFEWEICGNIYVKNTATGAIKKLTNYHMSHENKPKQIAWFNDTLMMVIEGYTWGTVSVGGSLYLVNANTGKYTLIMEHLPGQEIAEVTKHRNSIVLRIAKWTDDNKMHYILYTRVLDADSVYQSMLH
jgi:hypothetical protein